MPREGPPGRRALKYVLGIPFLNDLAPWVEKGAVQETWSVRATSDETTEQDEQSGTASPASMPLENRSTSVTSVPAILVRKVNTAPEFNTSGGTP